MDSIEDGPHTESQPVDGEKTAHSDEPPIDIQLLADKVYKLMRDELRLEKARSGRSCPSGGR